MMMALVAVNFWGGLALDRLQPLKKIFLKKSDKIVAFFSKCPTKIIQ